MVNPIANGAFSREYLRSIYHGMTNGQSLGRRVVIDEGGYRVSFDSADDSVTVEVRLTDTATGVPSWFVTVSYTAV